MKLNIAIIGSGFSALSAACYLTKDGHEVTIFEKNKMIGGRARQLKKEGFTFDMGPTWYWMPDVFERFFADFGTLPSDYYQLEKLNPAYKVYFAKDDFITIEDTLEKICKTFEHEEAGSSQKLQKFMANVQHNYDVAIKDLVYRPGVSPFELMTPVTLKKINQFFSTIKKDVCKEFKNNVATAIIADDIAYPCDIVLSGADYHHSENLLEEKYRQYSQAYWEKKIFAPSSLLFYVAFDKKLKNVNHHTLFFDVNFEAHAKAIYDHPKWPENPLFYASFPSLTDKSVAPEDQEAGIFLIPLAAGLENTAELRSIYFDKIIARFEDLTYQSVKNNIIFKESFCVKDFINDYNSYKGNAYGMANTLMQTAFLRPKLKSKKVKNLYFTGQLTVPGPGVPPALISGKLVAELIKKNHTPKAHESVI